MKITRLEQPVPVPAPGPATAPAPSRFPPRRSGDEAAENGAGQVFAIGPIPPPPILSDDELLQLGSGEPPRQRGRADRGLDVPPPAHVPPPAPPETSKSRGSRGRGRGAR